MGEEPGAGGTVRYVDSSVERLQVKVSQSGRRPLSGGLQWPAVPLAATGAGGEFVAGVRFRAWQPSSCLHPTIGVHSPLVFDLVDTWTGEAVAGCTYHVAHPGGRHHETLPVNSYEAESRRRARFVPFGHGHGPRSVTGGAVHPDTPNTLDLRLQ